MTESTQLQATESNNAGVTKMEPPPPLTSTSPAPSTATAMEQLQQQHLVQQQQQYALKWNDFQSSILSSFRHLRDEEDFVDVTLACDQRSFTAHKVVLSACSPYFRKLLKANPCEHPIVILRDVRCEDVENLLSFMYNGEVNVSHEQLPDFLKTAHLLQIRGLADVTGSGSTLMAGFNATAAAAVAAAANNNNKQQQQQHHNNNSISNNNNKFNFAAATAATGGNGNNNNNNNNTLVTPFNTPTLMGSTIAAAAALSAAAAGAASLAAATGNSNNNNINSNSSSSNNNNNNNNINNQNSSSNINNINNNSSTFSNALSVAINSAAAAAANTPAIQELKASSASPANHHWDLTEADSNRNSHLTPPPQKRIKSADLFRAQHGISPERLLLEREFPVAGQHALTRERNRDRDRSRETSRDRERSMELRESLLGQALENSNGQQLGGGNQKPHVDLASLHAQSAGEDSNSSDTEPSDRGDGQQDDSMNGSLDNQRSHSFPSAFLGLQGIPGLLPGPSGMGANDFVTRRSLEMRVRATDPRPCPKCGKIYRSAHTLRTHLEDKHTVCPGYRCVLCGTVAKSRNSLHSHMSRQHRGISTKDLPVLPMPSAFDPDLASRLLAKAGVKISPAELRARASPTSGGGSGGGGGGNGGTGPKMDLGGGGGMNDDAEDSDDDPEDLTTGSGLYGSAAGGAVGLGNDLSRYHESLLSNFGHANTTISRIRNEAAAAAAAAAAMGQQQQKDLVGVGGGSGQIPTSTAAGQSLLDTYLQFITENTFGMGMTQEHAAAAALHAAKMAQLNAMGHGLDKIPAGLLQPQFDLSKIGVSAAGNYIGSPNGGGLTIEPIMRRPVVEANSSSSSISPTTNGPSAIAIAGNTATSTTASSSSNLGVTGTDIRRGDSSEPMDLGLDNNQSGSNNEGGGSHSDHEDNYSEDEGVHNT